MRSAPNGTKVRINEFPSGVVSPVHRTQSVDYGIVLSGEVAPVLDDEGKALSGRLTAAGPGTMEYRHLDVSRERQWADSPHNWPAGASTAWSTTPACPTAGG